MIIELIDNTGRPFSLFISHIDSVSAHTPTKTRITTVSGECFYAPLPYEDVIQKINSAKLR